MASDWKQIDEKLIRRGELILELGFVEGYREELEAMNRGKEGRPYRLSRTYIQFITAVRYLYQMPYRQLEGFTRALHRLSSPNSWRATTRASGSAASTSTPTPTSR